MLCQVLNVAAKRYQSNRLHDSDMPWQETNCYMDVWIELIHALGFEVEPVLGFTVAVDFEQDQWTFFKPPLNDLSVLYGIEVEELTLWRPLPIQCSSQITAGNLPLLEVDSFYLPDTEAADYKRNHVKTTIAINEIDQNSRRLGYFHNCGYHELQGADYEGLFRLDRDTPKDYLPPYCEIIKTKTISRAGPSRSDVMALLKQHADRRPSKNPFVSYGNQFDEHLDWIRTGGLNTYHSYVFANLRQCGSAFDLASRFLYWLDKDGTQGWRQPAQQFADISSVSKMMLLKLARIASNKREADFRPQFARMSDCWQKGSEKLDTLLARV